jgi:hypothetical protein
MSWRLWRGALLHGVGGAAPKLFEWIGNSARRRSDAPSRERERIAAPVQLYISRLINFIAELIINFDAAINNECYWLEQRCSQSIILCVWVSESANKCMRRFSSGWNLMFEYSFIDSWVLMKQQLHAPYFASIDACETSKVQRRLHSFL